MLSMFGTAFAAVFTNPFCIVMVLLGVIIGIIFGAVPGLTATTAIAMFLPMTYSMDASVGISTLTALYIGGISGGLVSAILLNMPGTPSSVATTFDGRPMALKGEAGKALGTGIFFSFLGTLFGIIFMIFLSPQIAKVAIKFGPWEYFSVILFALTLIASLAGDSLVKGIISGLLGIMFATVGQAPVDAVPRYTFGSTELSAGFNILPVLVGLFAISEIMHTAGTLKTADPLKVNQQVKIKGLGFSGAEFRSQIGNGLRSALIGLGVGILPGIGGATSNILAYSVAKNQSKYPEKFGTGIMDGLVASETSNNASVGGAMIPLLTLGIPGDSTTAVLLGGFLLHGIQPGPLLFSTSGPLVYSVFVTMILASFLMVIVMYGGLKGFVKVLSVPMNILLPLIITLCVVGAFSLNSRLFDVWSLILFGIVGYAMNWFDYPLPPFILGFILGGSFESNLREGLQSSQGNFFACFQQPIACVFMVLTIVSLFLTIRKNVLDAKKKVVTAKPEV